MSRKPSRSQKTLDLAEEILKDVLGSAPEGWAIQEITTSDQMEQRARTVIAGFEWARGAMAALLEQEKYLSPQARVTLWLGFEIGRRIGLLTAEGELQRPLATRVVQMRAHDQNLHGTRVSGEERTTIIDLNEQLRSEFPKPHVRYREIAERVSTKDRRTKADRVRYIITGPRQTNPHNRGRLKKRKES